MAKGKKTAALTLEERLEQALMPEDEQPYPVPENWCWTRISSINCYTGSSSDPAKAPDEQYELYSVPSSADGYPEIILGKEIGSSKQTVIKGDVLLCKINPRINRVWKVSQHTSNTLLASSEWIVFRNKLLNSDYFVLCFQSKYFREFMLSNVSGVGGSLMRAQPKYVQEYPVPIPPLAEQQRIVDRIESLFAKLDEAKEKAQAALDSFETRKASILHKAFTGELTAKWRKENGVWMDSWETIRFGDIILDGPQNGLYKPQTAYGNGTKIIRIDGFYDGNIEPWDTLKSLELSSVERELYGLKQGDLLVNRVNSMAYLGKSALVRTLPNECVFESNVMRLSLKLQLVCPEFAIRFLNSAAGLSELRKNAKQAVNQASINQQDVKNVEFPLPSINEQIEIIRLLDDFFTKEQKAKELCSVLDNIDLIKKSILARAFRGELGTNDPSEESAMDLLKSII